jgi:RNA 3'-terminal phosphate cyclase
MQTVAILQLIRRGFFPKGGGRIELDVWPLLPGKALQASSHYRYIITLIVYTRGMMLQTSSVRKLVSNLSTPALKNIDMKF